jgi:hypothetical protein
MRLATDSVKMAARKNSEVPEISKNIESACSIGELVPMVLALLPPPPPGLPRALSGRGASKRARAAALRERMFRFSAIYNAAYMVRHTQYLNDAAREESMRHFVVTLAKEMRHCNDFEALMYAVADSLTSNPLGLPWET